MKGNKEFLKLELGWVRQIRCGRRVELIAAAAQREQEIISELKTLENSNLALVASERSESPEIED